LDHVVVIGSFLRKDHPLLAQRFRQAAKAGQRVVLLDVAADDPLLPLAGRLTVAPSALPAAVVELAVAVNQLRGQTVPAEFASVQPSAAVAELAKLLAASEKAGVFLGNLAMQHPDASVLGRHAEWLAETLGGRLGVLTEGGNTVGGYLAGAVPSNQGLTAQQMLSQPLKAYIVLHAEPLLDADNGPKAVVVLKKAELVLA